MGSDHYTPNGGKNHSGQGWQYSQPNGSQPNGSQPSGGQPPRRPNFNIGDWIPIIVLFCIPSGFTQIIAIIWALSKVSNMFSRQQKEKFGRDVRHAATEVGKAVRKEVDGMKTQQAKSTSSQTAEAQQKKDTARTYSYAGTGKPASAAKRLKKPTGGTALVVLGIIFAAGCGLPALICLLTSAFMGFNIMMLFTLAALCMLGGGIKLNHRKERILNYLAYIGTNREVSLPHMAASFGVSIKKLCKDLRYMLAKGILPTGYLDLAEGKLFLTETGYQAREAEPVREEAPNPDERVDSDILQEIRQVNDEIPDAVMSAKIARIEEITGKILSYQKSHPEKAGQLRSFLNYYLPTTLKILRAYAQLDAQGIEGENISATKARIEGMMDQVVAGFEKQLDRLFQDQAMDISSDVKVLENMLQKDGLSGGGQTMTMNF